MCLNIQSGSQIVGTRQHGDDDFLFDLIRSQIEREHILSGLIELVVRFGEKNPCLFRLVIQQVPVGSLVQASGWVSCVPGFGICTRLMHCDRYVPSRSCCSSLSMFRCKPAKKFSVVISSTPGG